MSCSCLGLDRTARHRRRDRRSESSLCPQWTDPNLKAEVVFAGGNSSSNARELGIGHSVGTVLKVTCGDGFELAPPKKRIKCGRKSGKMDETLKKHSQTNDFSEWRPGMPGCLPLKCRLPPIREGGRFKMGTTQLPDEGEIAHGKTVELECDEGYQR